MVAPSPSPNLRRFSRGLREVARAEQSPRDAGREMARIGLGLLFLGAALAIAELQVGGGASTNAFVIAAGLLGGYMALNIGANDVANNMGPAVGSKAITMGGALLIAALFEAMGALIAGGDVVETISQDIVPLEHMPDSVTFMTVMMGALFAAAISINVATFVGTPISTTHAVVGGVIGGGMAAMGAAAVNWSVTLTIAASWLGSPLLGGITAALFLAFIKTAVLAKKDKVAAARRWVPILVAILAASFTAYLMMKGFRRLWHPEAWQIFTISIVVFFAVWTVVRPAVLRASDNLENRRNAVSDLFTIPLICAAALLSFAHGANDVANAVGPLAAIVGLATNGVIAAEVPVPFWVMGIGAAGISAGLVLYGPKLIRTVGEEITKLDRVRAFTVALSAAITVIVASALGLPVSSTHIAVGAVFGVGFYREYVANAGAGNRRKRRLVRRRHLLNISLAWLLTVPLAALLSGGVYLLLNSVFP